MLLTQYVGLGRVEHILGPGRVYRTREGKGFLLSS